ncbi:hypothetical protein SAMN05660836_01343 [Thermodesulforhabdus norvegica]|uniref:Uncharacterized protein n=2 Tax=Thermodesulforhabdus norvegica TaxID=39841 RepID=A0A1I4TCV4_9BACT|nr:hypothetical protein SAMN05660836_01343 [Thermodesulforhabdus norvegica]
MEKLAFLCLSTALAVPVKAVLLHLLNLNIPILTHKTPWWNAKWVTESPWGSFVCFFVVFSFVYSCLFLLWGLIQEFAVIRLSGRRSIKNPTTVSPEEINGFLHPYRRMKWLLERLPSENLMVSCNHRLANYDVNYAGYHWNVIKKLIFLLLMSGWILSLYRFYFFASGIIQGDFTVHNLGRYVALSFRAFYHVFLACMVVFLIGYIGYRVWLHYITLMDDFFYEAFLETYGGSGRKQDSAVNDLDEIRFRILRIEKMVETLVSALHRQRANDKGS